MNENIKRAFLKYDTVIFDAGAVLLNWQPDQIIARSIPDKELGQKILSNSVLHKDWVDFDQGLISLEALKINICKRSGASLEDFDRFYAEVLRSLTPISETVALLEELHNLRKRLYLLSNMPNEIWQHLIKAYSFWNRFHGLVLSYEIKLVKPHKEIYQYLLNKYKVSAENCIFIDDRIDNVEGAKAAGIYALQFSSCEQVISQLSLPA